MPPVLGAIAAAIGSIFVPGAGVGTALAIGARILSAVIGVAISFAVSAVSAALAPTPDKPKLAQRRMEILATLRDPIRSREIVVGKIRKGGTLALLTTTNNQQHLHMVICLAGHECEAIEEVYFNETLAFDAAGNVQAAFSGKAFLYKHLGTDSQAADADLITNVPEWTSNHRLRGITYIYLKLIFDRNVFSAVPNVSAVVKGKKFYDPRTTLTAWTDNAALVSAGYFNDATYGLGAAYGTEIDNTELSAAANECDELVNIPGPATEKRYTINGVIDSGEEFQANVERLLTAMHGRAIYSGGKWYIKAGAYETPTVSLDEDDLRGNLQISARLPRRELFNAVRGVFISANNLYQPADFPPLTSATFETQDNGERIWKDIELPYTATETMAYRIAKIDLYASREQISLVYPCSLKALQLKAGETVKITNSRMGWTDKVFVIKDWTFVIHEIDNAPVLGINLALRETSSAVYDVTADEQTLIDNAPDTSLPAPDFTVTTIRVAPVATSSPSGNVVSAVGSVGGDITAHAAAADPHTGYQKESEKNAANGYCGLDAGGKVASAQLALVDGDIPAAIARDSEITTAVSDHEGAADPHTGYQRESEKDAASGYAGLNSSSRVTKGADTTDDLIVDTSAKGLVLKDAQGTPHYWRLGIVAGAVVPSDLGTTKP